LLAYGKTIGIETAFKGMSRIKNIILKNKVTVQSSFFSGKETVAEVTVQILVDYT